MVLLWASSASIQSFAPLFLPLIFIEHLLGSVMVLGQEVQQGLGQT